jgi:hypothetical protein
MMDNLLGMILAAMDNKKRVAGRNISDAVMAPKDTFDRNMARTQEDSNAIEIALGFTPLGAGKVGKLLTPAENKFFSSVKSSKGDLADLLENVPSAEIRNGRLTISPKDQDALSTYIDDTVRLNEGELLPPSFYSGKFNAE